MSKVSYRPEIDGIRAIAVLGVVLFHAGVGFPGGYVGVDIFFVLSGFLITGIILRSLDDESFSILNFWERRLRRIFPALFVVVIAILSAGYLMLLPADLAHLGSSSKYQSLMLANIFFWRSTDYFGGPAESQPLLHSWSLAVEEQFYLIFPMILIFLRKRPRRTIALVIAGLAAASFLTSAYGTRFHPSAAFYLLPTRAWELLAGSLLATLPAATDPNRLRDELLSIAGLALIVFAMFAYSSTTSFPGFAAILPVVGTVAILFATGATKNTTVGRLLSLRYVVFVGLISYSLYLWHWPILAYCRYLIPSMSQMQIALALLSTLALSVCSWRFIESPFRNRQTVSNRSVLIAISICLTIAVFLFGLACQRTGGMPTRYDERLAVLLDDVSWSGGKLQIVDTKQILAGELPQIGATNVASSPDFLLWGDSHGLMLSDVMHRAAMEEGVSGDAIIKHGVPPMFGLWRPEVDPDGSSAKLHDDAVREYLERFSPRNVLLVCRWSFYSNNGYTALERKHNSHLAKQVNLFTDAPDAVLSPESSYLAFSRQLQNLASICEKLNITLWILKQVPETAEIECAKRFLMNHTHPSWSPLPDRTLTIEDHRERQKWAEMAFNSMASKNVEFVDPAPFFFNENGRTVNYDGGRAFYRDDDHLTKHGAEKLFGVLKQVFSKMKNGESGNL